MNNRFAIVELYCGDSGKIGFYNSQELGITKAMTKLGYQCFVFYPDASLAEINEETIEGTTIVRVPAKKIGVHGFYEPTVLKEYHIDFAQIDSDNQMNAPKMIRYCMKQGIKFYNYMGTLGSDSDKWTKKLLSSLLIRNNIRYYEKSKCFVKTKRVFDAAKKEGIDDVQIVHVGLDFSLIPEIEKDCDSIRRELGIPENRKILLFVGRLDPYKRPMQMIEVMRKLDDGYYGVMIGTGSLSEEINRSIKENNLSSRIKRIEKIENSKIHKFYKAADYFLNFNEKEIFGMSMLEAMYQGCNVIAIASPGACEIISEESGYVVDGIDQMAQIIEKSERKDERIIRQRIIDHFSWDSSAKIFDEYLKGESR